MVKQIEVAHEGIVFPLRDEYRRVNYTLEGRKEAYSKSGDFDTLLWPENAEDTPSCADHWLPMPSGWLRIHTVPRRRMFTPHHVDGGPSDLEKL